MAHPRSFRVALASMPPKTRCACRKGRCGKLAKWILYSSTQRGQTLPLCSGHATEFLDRYDVAANAAVLWADGSVVQLLPPEEAVA